jgi:hypothetical protein
MSVWSDDPEFFDEWIEKRALEGKLGPTIQQDVEAGILAGYEIWSIPDIDPKGDLGCEAMQDYMERFVR